MPTTSWNHPPEADDGHSPRTGDTNGAVDGTRFLKGHGAGNDFVIIPDQHGEQRITPEQVTRWCARHTGLGGDGLIRVVRTGALTDADLAHDARDQLADTEWFMDYRNADGSVAQMCGNGVRVFVEALRFLGYVDLPVGESIRVGTRSGVKTVTRTETGYAANLGPWTLIYPEQARGQGSDLVVGIHGLEVPRPGLSISMGNPHTVVALAHAEELERADLTRAPRVEPAPEEGTNVELVTLEDPLIHAGVGQITMRVYERGVGETQACGTGVCAAAAAVRYWAGEGAPRAWNVRVPGGELSAEFVRAGDGREDVVLGGPARIVATGVLLAD